MTTALWLMAIQGAIGAFDTVYYHEWRARLPARGVHAAAELKLHACRDFLYALIFGTLPWLGWQGFWAVAILAVFVAEIVLTMADFIVEIRVRKPIGDVYGGERLTHAAMGIVYGAMVANLLPVLAEWWSHQTKFVATTVATPESLRYLLAIMAIGVFVSGVRDLYAALGLPGGTWPWIPEGIADV
jgi:hypothetical protein